MDALPFLLAGIGVVVSALLTFVVIRWGRGGWGMDSPDRHRKQHERPISRLGGLPVAVVLFGGLAVLGTFRPEAVLPYWPVWLGCLLIFLIGFVDDLKPLGAKVKLVGQIGVALICFSLGVEINLISNPFGPGAIELGVLALPISLLWLVAVPNIVNLIDGMDGLAGGIGLFLCLTLGLVGVYSEEHEIVILASMLMAGGLLGFLVFNFPPAKIFLGDGGAYLIGFFVASVSMASSNKGAIAAALLVVMISLGLPILDTTFAILRRAIRGLPLFRGDAEHIHHRLISLGYTKNMALVVLYAVCGVLSLVGLSIFWSRGQTLPIALAAFAVIAYFAARYLGYIGHWKEMKGQMADALARRRDVQYAVLHGQLLEVEVERCESPAEFLELLERHAARVGFALHTAEGRTPLPLPLADGTPFGLHVRASQRKPRDWVALGEPFKLAYAAALDRWPPDELAASLAALAETRRSVKHEHSSPELPQTTGV